MSVLEMLYLAATGEAALFLWVGAQPHSPVVSSNSLGGSWATGTVKELTGEHSLSWASEGLGAGVFRMSPVLLGS